MITPPTRVSGAISRWGHAYYHRPGTHEAGRPTAAFDFDGTLAPFRGQGPDPAVSARLLVLLAPAYNLAIFSNRSTQSKLTAARRCQPIADFLAALPPAVADRVSVYAAFCDDVNRKPQTGLWDAYVEQHGRPAFAFYCGDAAGRDGDHSDSDLLFAHNIGVPFVTPQALFGRTGYRNREGPAPVPWREELALPDLPAELTPSEDRTRQRAAAIGKLVAALNAAANAAAEGGVCVIMVGAPGSGKSRIAQALLAAHPALTVVSNDLQGCALKPFLKAVSGSPKPRGFVVDNTGGDAASRRAYAEPAHSNGYRVFVCVVDTPPAVCAHLAALRCSRGGRPVPAIARAVWYKRHEPVTAEELAQWGAALVTVPFAPDAADAGLTERRF